MLKMTKRAFPEDREQTVIPAVFGKIRLELEMNETVQDKLGMNEIYPEGGS